MNLLIITAKYPSDIRPWEGTFVRQLIHDMHTLGANSVVISPESLINFFKHKKLLPFFEERDEIPVYRPRTLSFSSILLPWGWSTYRWTIWGFSAAILLKVRHLNKRFDICYAHFLYPCGSAALYVANCLGIPAVLALGESSFDHYEAHLGVARICKDLSRFAWIITPSEVIKTRSAERYGVPQERVSVFPNAVDEQIFYPRDKKQIRRRLGLPLDQPIIIFVGHLIERKGPLRVLKAVHSFPEIGVVFLGKGPQVPTGPQVLYRGTVPHKEVGEWLSAADIFVLPTLAEGSCNAILEALACGLPIVSTDLPFNRELLDPSVGVLVNPLDIKGIGGAIMSLANDPAKRRNMSLAAINHARYFRSQERAQRILKVLQEFCQTPS